MDQYTITIHPAGAGVTSNWPGSNQLLTHLYAQIGCSLVTPIGLSEQLTLWCDDEGMLAVDAEINEVATKLCSVFGPVRRYLVGSVVLTGPADATGNTLPLGPAAVAVLARILDTVNDLPMPRLGH